MRVSLEEQVKIASSLDAIILFGGEPAGNLRTKLVAELYEGVRGGGRDSLPIIPSGYCSGTYGKDYVPRITEAQEMTEGLIKLGVNQEDIFLEEESKDTVGNLIYPIPIIQQIVSGSTGDINVGIATGDFRIPRALYIGGVVLPNFPRKFIIHPIPIEEPNNLASRIRESLIQKAIAFDFKRFGVRNMGGNQEALEEYLAELNPMYNENAPFGPYKLIFFIEHLRRLREMKKSLA